MIVMLALATGPLEGKIGMNKLGVALLTIASVLFIVVLTVFAIGFIRGGTPVGIAAGAGLMLMALLGLWALWVEIRFGLRTGRLGAEMEAAGALPTDEVEYLPSGRIVRSDAEALIPKYRAHAEVDPGDWRRLYNLGLVYNAAGESKAGRAAMRQAIALHG